MIPTESLRRRGRVHLPWIFRVLTRDVSGMVGLFIVAGVIASALLAPWLAPYPDQGRGAPNILAKLHAPGSKYLLGTDEMGRDLLSRILFAGRPSLMMAMVVVAMGVAIGVPIGAAAGYFGGWLDEVLMRITDIFLAFTPLLLAIVLATAIGPGFWSAVVALGISWWPWYARLARGQAVSIRRRAFVEAAEGIGVRSPVILARHIVPNLIGPVVVQATLDLSSVILIASGLSFLGLGAQPPAADWGVMVSDGRIYFLGFPWYAAFPGFAIIIVSVGFVLLGDGLRRALRVGPLDVIL